MASIIRIKRSSVAGNPTTLAAGELAYSALTDNGSNGGDRLYIGIGSETAGNAANHFVIGGKYFTDMMDHTPGVLTASSALITDASSKLDNLKVDNLDLNGNTISTTNSNGDLLITPNGSGKTVITNLYIGDTSTSLTEFIQDVTGGQIVSGDGVDATYSDSAGTTTLSLNTEYAQDLVAAMLTGGVHSGISAAYDDAGGVVGLSLTTLLDGTTNKNPGTYGSTTAIPVLTVDAKGRITAITTSSIATSFTIAGDSGTPDVVNGGETLTFTGTDPIDTAITGNTVTISAKDATTTTKGVASFDTNSFSVTSGAVSVKSGGITNTQLVNSSLTIGSTTTSLGGTSTSLAGLTQLDVDNIRVDGNEISSTNTNGDISLNPNGTGVVNVNSSRITGVSTPTADTDAANKAYVDNTVSGLSYKEAVNLLATTNVALTGSTGTLVIDGHAALDSTDNGVYRLLLIGQTTASQNGIYVYNDNGTSYTLTRSLDADAYDELIGTSVFVLEGATYANTGWVQSNHYLTDFSGQSWVQFSGAGAYTAGNGLTQSGTIFNVGAGNGITVGADTVSLATTVAGNGLTYTNGVLDIGGTADRITVGSDSIDIASTYVGQTSIVTLGTITTGTWNATTISTLKGGTGLTSYTTGDILYASATNTLARLSAGTNGQVLQMNSSGVPVWGDLDGGTY